MEKLLDMLNLPSQSIVYEGNMISSKVQAQGNITISLSDELQEILGAESKRVVMNLQRTPANGTTLPLNPLSKVDFDVGKLYPITAVCSGLRASSYIDGLGEVAVLGHFEHGMSPSYKSDFILTDHSGFLEIKLLNEKLEPLKIPFEVDIRFVFTVRNAEFTPQL